MRRQNKRVLAESHKVSETFLISIYDRIVEFLFPLSHIGFTRIHGWVESCPLRKHFNALSLGKAILYIPHVRDRIDIFKGDWWILVSITSEFFVNLIHCLIHLWRLIQRTLHRCCLVWIEDATPQLKWITDSSSICMKKFFIIEECHGKNASTLFLLAKLKKTPQRPMDWLSGMNNWIYVRQFLFYTTMERGNAILSIFPLKTKLNYTWNFCWYRWNFILSLFIMFLNKIV